MIKPIFKIDLSSSNNESFENFDQIFQEYNDAYTSKKKAVDDLFSEIKKIKKLLLIATGALMNSTSSQQGESIPGVAHAISIEL
jgi:hypothetical protein